MRRTGWTTQWIVGVGLCLAAATVSWTYPAEAGLITGHVQDEKRVFQPGASFNVKVSADKLVNVKTDDKGNYRIFLPPGIYTITFPDNRTAEILSRPEPIRQDIHLK